MKRQEKQKPSALSPATQMALGASLLLLAAFAVYWPALHGGFVMDDILWIENNPYLKSFDGLLNLWRGTNQPDFFPLTATSFWIEWRCWELNPTGYHVTNVILHAVSGVILWRIFRRVAIPGAFLGALLFVVHPVNVESVAWITERKNTLSMFFYLLSVLWFLKSEERKPRFYFALSLIAFLFALLSKTSVVMLPLVLLGLGWWRRGKIDRRDGLRSLPYFGLSLILGLVTVWFQSHHAIATEVVLNATFGARVASAGRAVWFYLGKALWPQGLAFIYPRWVIDPNSAVAYLPVIALVIAALALWFYRRNKWGRPLIFGLGYFVIMLLPILGFINIYYFQYSMVADHWQYYAIIGGIALAVGLINSPLKTVPAIIVVIIFSALARQQAALYSDPQKIWEDTVQKNPGSWVAHNSLGHYLGRTPEAVEHFRAALRLNPDSVETHVNLATVLMNTGHADEALDEFELAKKLNPNAWAIWYDLGLLLGAQNKNAEAEAAYRGAIRLEPNIAQEHSNLGLVLQKEGKVADAMKELAESIRLQPNDAAALNNLAWLLATEADAKLRNGAEAVRLANQAVELTQSNNPGTLDTLAAAYAENGDFAKAIETATKALVLKSISSSMAAPIQARLELYRAHRPFRNSPTP